MTIWLWAGFLAFVGLMLWIDLGVINRKAHKVRAREALAWTAVCVVLALAFTGVVYYVFEHQAMGVNPALVLQQTTPHASDETALPHPADQPPPGDQPAPTPTDTPAPGKTTGAGRAAALQFLTAWIIEYSLSLDNIFVIAVIFAYFRVPGEYQHRVLFWGILGVLVMRGVLIIAGISLINLFDWLTYPLGALLLFSAAKMLAVKSEDMDFESNLVVRLTRRFLPLSPKFDGQKFMTYLPEAEGGRRVFTPLMLVLLVITVVDTVFALDSIPAVFAITRDPFIAFTSNIFAVLGLRSMYFALAAVIDKFKYLKVSLVIVLAYVGLKMIIQHHIHIPTWVSLAVILGSLGGGIAASMLVDRRGRTGREAPLGPDVERVARLTLRQMRRAVVLVVGLTVVLIGLIMLGPVPGPGIVVVPVGLGILAAEFVWARHLLKMFQVRAEKIGHQAEEIFIKRPRPWLIPLVFGATASVITGLLAFKVLGPWAVAGASIGIVIGQVLWANATMTRYRRFILTHPAAARADARPPIWVVPVVLGGTVALLLAALNNDHPRFPPTEIVKTAVGLIVGEAVWAAMWISAWLGAIPRPPASAPLLPDRQESP
jgi:tellurite resistance protein TerC